MPRSPAQNDAMLDGRCSTSHRTAPWRKAYFLDSSPILSQIQGDFPSDAAF